MVHARSYAKINMSLKVEGLLKNKYHSIKSIMSTIELRDDLFMAIDNDVKVCSDTFIGRQEDNLVYKVVMELKERYNIQHGVKIHIGKNIPIGGGLGGGSSNAAAAILGLNELWELNMTYDDMYEVAIKMGSDVPFFLNEGLAIAEGRGELLTPIDIDLDFYIVLVCPSYGLSTAEVYKKYIQKEDDSRFEDFYEKLLTGDIDVFGPAMFNDLENSASDFINCTSHVKACKIKQDLLDAGCIGAVMSGSGSVVYGVTHNREEADKICEIIKREHRNYRILVTRNKKKAIT